MKSALIKPIQVGNLTLGSNLVQGPLAGYSCAPFRVLANQYGRPGFCMTEMISAKDLRRRKIFSKRYTLKSEKEGLLAYQFSADNVDDLAYAVAFVTQYGADLIDLNCGCPVSKIRGKGCGSRLLENPEQLYRLVCAMKQATSCPVSVKIRISETQTQNQAVVDAVLSAGVDMITVHGRLWTHKYDVPCQYDDICKVVQYVNNRVPVFANGDVEDLNSAQLAFEKTGCSGLMIARASVGQPWLYEQISSEYDQRKFLMPSNVEIGEIFLKHVEGLIELEGEYIAILQTRKLAKYYARTLKKKQGWIAGMQSVSKFEEVHVLVKQFFHV